MIRLGFQELCRPSRILYISYTHVFFPLYYFTLSHLIRFLCPSPLPCTRLFHHFFPFLSIPYHIFYHCFDPIRFLFFPTLIVVFFLIPFLPSPVSLPFLCFPFLCLPFVPFPLPFLCLPSRPFDFPSLRLLPSIPFLSLSLLLFPYCLYTFPSLLFSLPSPPFPSFLYITFPTLRLFTLPFLPFPSHPTRSRHFHHLPFNFSPHFFPRDSSAFSRSW